MFFMAEYDNPGTLGPFSVLQKLAQSVFHSVSGRTAGLATVDIGASTELTRLFFPFLMFVGGAAGSMAGGIKVATLAVIIAATISSVKGRLQTEAFGREIPHFQVHRALTVAALAMTFIFIVSLVLMLTEEDIPFLNLFFGHDIRLRDHGPVDRCPAPSQPCRQDTIHDSHVRRAAGTPHHGPRVDPKGRGYGVPFCPGKG